MCIIFNFGSTSFTSVGDSDINFNGIIVAAENHRNDNLTLFTAWMYYFISV